MSIFCIPEILGLLTEIQKWDGSRMLTISLDSCITIESLWLHLQVMVLVGKSLLQLLAININMSLAILESIPPPPINTILNHSMSFVVISPNSRMSSSIEQSVPLLLISKELWSAPNGGQFLKQISKEATRAMNGNLISTPSNKISNWKLQVL